MYGAFRYALTDAVDAYLEASYSKNEMDFTIQPVPISDQFALPANHPLFNVAPYNGFATIRLQPTSPYYPTASCSRGPAVRRRICSFAIDRKSQAIANGLTRSNNRASSSASSGDAGGWDFDVALTYTETKLEEVYRNGAPSYERILPLLNSGQVNFFGPNTPEILAQIDATQFRGEAYSTKTAAGHRCQCHARSLRPAGGSSRLAFGAEFRNEKFETNPSPAIQSGDIASYGGNFLPIDQDRDVTAAFLEVNVPILESLEANAAVRFDDYQGTGNKTVPKLSLRWRPVDSFLLRASAGKGFRAPSLSELWQPQVTGVSAPGLNDPERCNHGRCEWRRQPGFAGLRDSVSNHARRQSGAQARRVGELHAGCGLRALAGFSVVSMPSESTSRIRSSSA